MAGRRRELSDDEQKAGDDVSIQDDEHVDKAKKNLLTSEDFELADALASSDKLWASKYFGFFHKSNLFLRSLHTSMHLLESLQD